MRYRLTSAARRDLFAIFLASLHDFGPQQAARYRDALSRELDYITAYPKAARIRAELRGEMRFHPFGAHVIVYSIRKSEIVVARILHGRQDATRHLPST